MIDLFITTINTVNEINEFLESIKKGNGNSLAIYDNNHKAKLFIHAKRIDANLYQIRNFVKDNLYNNKITDIICTKSQANVIIIWDYNHPNKSVIKPKSKNSYYAVDIYLKDLGNQRIFIN